VSAVNSGAGTDRARGSGTRSGLESDPDDVRVGPLEWPEFDETDYWSWERVQGRVGASLFTIWLIPTTVEALGLGRPTVPVLTLTVGYGVAYLAVWWLAQGWPPRRRIALVVALFALGIGYQVATGPASSPAVLGFAVSATMILLPLRWAARIGLACVGGATLASWLVQHQVDWQDILILALITVTTLSISRISRLVTRLHAAQAEVRTLAVAEERARLARDLHDVLGHSLTTITVKTALARRLLESGAGQERVMEEIRDTEELSRRALADIRATVSGQRRGSLAVELVTARAALRAAGIEADLPRAVDDVAAGLEEPLAYVLREGVTNVVRHSGASRCTVRLGARWLEVVDDGPGPTEPTAAEGTGLSGLAERMAAVHGTLTAGPLPTGGYRLRAEVAE
jgi:two-component system sensor histidine kinase DesK